jgi:nitrogen fixation NifU-like protein
LSKEDFDRFINNLQKEIYEKEKEAFSDRIIELFHQPHNWGALSPEDTTISEAYTGPCGDTMQFFFKIKEGIIERVTFITDGCGPTVATGSQATIMIEGKSIKDVENLKSEDIDSALHGLPDDHKHCAELAARTIKKALDKYKNLINE